MDSTIIHRHPIGVIAYLATGAIVALLIYFGAVLLYQGEWLNQWGYRMMLTVAALAILWSWVLAITYWRSTIRLDSNGITVTSYRGLFFSTTAQADWSEIQDVAYTRGGILASWLDYGTVLVQTAGTRTNLELSMVPSPDALAGYIDGKS